MEGQALHTTLHTHCLVVVWLESEPEEETSPLTSSGPGGMWGLFVPCGVRGNQLINSYGGIYR